MDHKLCMASTNIADHFSFGQGKLDDYGFWEKPCPVCAREHEKQHPEEGPCWPYKAKEGRASKKLQTKVKAVNRANERANQLYEDMVKIFQPLVGKQILTQSGALLAKIGPKVATLLPNNIELMVYPYTSIHSLAYVVKTSEVCDGIAYYHETVVRIGEIQQSKLVEIYEHPHFPTTYDADAIVEARLAYQEAKKVADELKNELYPFGEYDR